MPIRKLSEPEDDSNMTENSGPEEAVTTGERKLYLEFHGRVIEHLGIQMYQSTSTRSPSWWRTHGTQTRLL